MSQNNKTLTYIIENLGLPLMGAIGQVQKKTSTPESDAEVMAKMLASSVDLAMAISAKMDVPSDTNKAEALRFHLTALGANALSQRIKIKGKEPSSIDVDSLKATTDSLFVFSENFSLDDQSIEYLNKLGMETVTGKELSDLHIIESLLPVISAMDHKDRGLFPNIAERLIKESDALSGQFNADSSSSAENAIFVKFKMLKLLSHIFVAIYPGIIGNSQPIGDVWQEFDRQKALVVLLIDYLLTGQSSVDIPHDEQEQAPAAKEEPAKEATPPPAPPAEPEVKQEPEAETKPEPEPVAAEEPQQEEVAAAAPPAEDSESKEGAGGGGTPLSFFKKD